MVFFCRCELHPVHGAHRPHCHSGTPVPEPAEAAAYTEGRYQGVRNSFPLAVPKHASN
jgi:hypothetical protein